MTLCDNHRGISLLCIAGKVLAQVILNRLIINVSETIVPESQCGFRAGRGTTDMVFAIRQLQEKCRKQNKELHMVFVDLTKAFDTVNREGLWKILRKFGCPEKMILLIASFHNGMQARVQENGETSDSCPVMNGVKQGCVLAPAYSPSYLLQCFLMPSETLTEECISSSAWMGGSLISEGCRPR